MARGRREIDRLHDEIQELFAELWQVPRFSGMRHGFRPQVDAYRTADPACLTIVVELPGVDPDAVQVVVSDRTLVIAGERPRPRVEGQVWQQLEIEYGPFQRRIALPEDVDPAEATADYENGFLTIVMPVVEKRRGPVQVPIEIRTRE
ncbi:MAG TPA: Hsp20/alpha crystallin family protein [Gaiellaceae bacterium]|jgi:HSP20 family protein